MPQLSVTMPVGNGGHEPNNTHAEAQKYEPMHSRCGTAELTGTYGGMKGPRTEEFMRMKYLYRCSLISPERNSHPNVPQS